MTLTHKELMALEHYLDVDRYGADGNPQTGKSLKYQILEFKNSKMMDFYNNNIISMKGHLCMFKSLYISICKYSLGINIDTAIYATFDRDTDKRIIKAFKLARDLYYMSRFEFDNIDPIIRTLGIPMIRYDSIERAVKRPKRG